MVSVLLLHNRYSLVWKAGKQSPLGHFNDFFFRIVDFWDIFQLSWELQKALLMYYPFRSQSTQ